MNKNILFILPLLLLSSCDGANDTTYFNINILDSDNGVITCENTKVKQGDFVTFYLEPESGYKADSITINNETFEVINNHYSYFNVQSDIVVKGDFEIAPILIQYFDVNGEVVFSLNINAGEDGQFYGIEPTKDPVGSTSYEFAGWSLTPNGEIIDSFTFYESTNLYPIFNEINYIFEMEDTLSILTLSTANLNINTTYPESYLVDGLISTDVEVATVDKTGLVTAVGSGNAKINFVVGGVIIDTCEVTVINNDNVYQEKCYAAGEVIYNHNMSVGKFKACQTLSKDKSGNLIDKKYIDFSGTFKFNAEISDSDNFGLQLCKEIYDAGNAKKAIQFGCTTGDTNNIFLKINGAIKVTASYNIGVNISYMLRAVTSPSDVSGKIQVDCYIDNVQLISITVNDLGSATNYCGLRYANASTSSNYITFSHLVVR